jgi:serine/threonine protein kinase
LEYLILIVCGIRDIHFWNVIHNDLKPENIVVERKNSDEKDGNYNPSSSSSSSSSSKSSNSNCTVLKFMNFEFAVLEKNENKLKESSLWSVLFYILFFFLIFIFSTFLRHQNVFVEIFQIFNQNITVLD